ncbi:MAG: hypothetical protein WCI23_02845 [Chlorobiaceae bacterium]
MRRTRTWLLPFVILLAGCSAGPDFVRPEPPKSSGYSSGVKTKGLESGSSSLGDTQRVTMGEVSSLW